MLHFKEKVSQNQEIIFYSKICRSVSQKEAVRTDNLNLQECIQAVKTYNKIGLIVHIILYFDSNFYV